MKIWQSKALKVPLNFLLIKNHKILTPPYSWNTAKVGVKHLSINHH